MPRTIIFLAVLLCVTAAFGQEQCFRTCSPNPTSPSYSGNLIASFQPRNARGTGRPTIPAVRAGNSVAVLGSSSYSYAVPVLHLPGRAGLDLDLTLYYNSDVWTFNGSGNSVTFNADHDWPSYGFRLDFGLLISGGNEYFLIEADGTKHVLASSGAGLFDSTDSSYINFNLNAGTTSWPLTYKNGTQVWYELFPSTQVGQSPSLLRPIRINDTNGNYITITYVSGTDQQINTITDTVGRVIQFNYNGSGYLSSITSSNGARTWASFSWSSPAYILNYKFTPAVQDSPANGAALTVLTGITLPNSTGYTFTYGAWGIVNQITNVSSSGLTRSYQAYDYPGAGTPLSAPPTYTHQTVFDGTSSRSWTYSTTMSNNLPSQSNISGPGGTTTTVNLYTATGDWKDGLVASMQTQDSAGNLLRQLDNTWTADATTNANPRVQSVLTTLSDTAQQSRTDFQYDAHGCVTDQKEYDFGLVLKREIATEYSPPASYTNAHILDLPTKMYVKDANGTNISRTDYAYTDVVTVPPNYAGASNHNDSYSAPRANLASITRYTDPVGGTGGIVRNFTYDSLGNLIAADLDCCSQKQWTFSSGTQYAYPDSVVRGPAGTQLTTSATYNLDTGTVASTTDENLKLTQFGYDSANRLHTLTQPDLVVITYTYDDSSLSPSVSVSNSANSAGQKTIVDGLGRTTQRQLLNLSTVLSRTDVQYDDINRQVKTSNPYLPGSENPVWTTTQFDQLGRPTVTTPPSGGSVQYKYLGNAATVSDPDTKQRRAFTDYRGELVQVDEPPAGQNTAGTGGSGIITINGAENSSTTTGTKATGSFAVSGQAFCYRPFICNDTCVKGPTECDSGTVSVTVNGVTFSTNYNTSTTAVAVANTLAGQITGHPVSETNLGNGTVDLTADLPGPNYPLSWSAVSNNSTYFDSPSVSVSLSGASLTGGVYPVTTYDSGTVTVTIGSLQASAAYNQTTNATALALANALAAQINIPSSNVTATINQISSTQVQLILNARSVGQATNYSVSTSPATASYSLAVTTTGGASTTALTGGTDPLTTFYTYDALGDLATVTQGGQTRNYTYDALGRMIKSVLPENGTTQFTYYDFGAVNTRTDGRGVITTYGYDGLHRLATISYNVGATGVPATAGVTYHYGTSTTDNNNGRLYSITDGTGSETYTYDSSVGRITQLTKVIAGATYNIGYHYNTAGELDQLTYPSGRVVNQGYDTAGRMSQVYDSTANYLSQMGYNSAQLPTGFTYGNGVQAAFGYNDHLQLSSLSYTQGASTLLNLTYNYLDSSGHNNGQIQSITDSRGAAFSTTYTYDSLGRLQQAQTNDLTAANTWKLAWTYDRYGNRLTQSLLGGTLAAGQPQLIVDAATNHISGFTYDGNGNLTQDASGTYTFDADNRMTQSVVGSITAAYAYDGSRLRVQKTAGATTTNYVFSGTKLIAEYTNGSLSKEYIYSGSKLLATVASGAVTYHHPDHLSNRLETNASGTVTRSFGHLPFGDPWYETGTADKWKFTSYEHDSESGLDYATERYYSNGYGRFTTVDLLPGSLQNPQSLNRYSYVANDPMNMVDPLGLHLFLVTSYSLCTFTTDGNGKVTDVDCNLISQTITDLEPGSDDGRGGSGDGSGSKPSKSKPKIDLNMLAKCIGSLFGVGTISFDPSAQGAGDGSLGKNGSFVGVGQDVVYGSFADNLLGGLNIITVTNDVNSKGITDMQDDAVADGRAQPGTVDTFVGETSKTDPHQTFTAAGIDPQGTLETQIFELGNALARITGQVPLTSNDESAAQKLDDCYHGK